MDASGVRASDLNALSLIDFAASRRCGSKSKRSTRISLARHSAMTNGFIPERFEKLAQQFGLSGHAGHAIDFALKVVCGVMGPRSSSATSCDL